MRVRRPDMTGGTVDVITARIHCPYCDAVYPSPDGGEIVTNTAESYRALPPTLVCKTCLCRFVKPTPLGWGQHYTGARLRPIERTRLEPGTGQTRPGASESTLTALTAIERADMALSTIRAARRLLARSGRR